MKWLKRLGVLLLLLYVVLCTALYLMQEKFIFHPSKLAESFEFWEGEEVEIEVEDAVFLNGVWIKTTAPQGLILYWHGNTGSNRRCLRQAEGMMGKGYDVLMVDYRGYGKSDGKILSEKQFMSDAQAVYDWVKERYNEDNIVIVGYSLGTGAASYLASENRPEALVLLAPYTSLLDMKNRIAPFTPDFLLKYQFNNQEALAKVKCPITMFHGTNDTVIDVENSKTLKNNFPAKIELFTLAGVSHRGLIFNRQFVSQLPKILH